MSRLFLCSTVAITLLTTWRIAATDTVFSQTYDEPAHIACGMEWLNRGTYTYETQHPPLARIASAMFPYLAGVRSQGLPDMWAEGNAILHSTGDYPRVLARARWGMLPFFLLLAAVVGAWGAFLYGREAGLCAVIAICGLPVVLTHAGRATTDLPFTAMFCTALLGAVWWIRRGGVGRAAIAGLLAGLALVSKFSFLGFFPACIAVLAWAECRAGSIDLRRLARQTAVFAGAALLVTLAAYRFSLAPIRTPAERPYPQVDALAGPAGTVHDVGYAVLEWPHYPLLCMVDGVQAVCRHLINGHRTFFLGEVRRHGSWIYFPLMLAVKTPIPFLLLASTGTILLVRRRNPVLAAPVLCAATILALCIPSRINLGTRHAMPVYPLLALGAGFGAVELYRRGAWGRLLAVGLLGSPLLICWAAHPDYASYFNVLASGHLEEFSTDSGSGDLYGLKDELQRLEVDRFSIAYDGSADLTRHGLPPFSILAPRERVSGWVAVSTVRLQDDNSTTPPYDGYRWLREYEPVARAGSIWIYRVPETKAEAN